MRHGWLFWDADQSEVADISVSWCSGSGTGGSLSVLGVQECVKHFEVHACEKHISPPHPATLGPHGDKS